MKPFYVRLSDNKKSSALFIRLNTWTKIRMPYSIETTRQVFFIFANKIFYNVWGILLNQMAKFFFFAQHFLFEQQYHFWSAFYSSSNYYFMRKVFQDEIKYYKMPTTMFIKLKQNIILASKNDTRKIFWFH